MARPIAAVLLLFQGLIISGTVRDQAGQPMANVTVRLVTRSDGVKVTSTDEKGKYLFTDLDIAFYDLSYERKGYITVTRRVGVKFDEDPGDDDPRAADVTMLPEP